MALGRNKDDELYMDKVQDSVEETGQGPEGESQELNRVPEAQVNEGAVDEESLGESFPKAHQVEPVYKIFVPFEDFEGRINQEDFSFKKDVAVKVTTDQANTWLDAKKGYVK